MADLHSAFNLFEQKLVFFAGVKLSAFLPHYFLGASARHFRKAGIDEKNALAIVGYEHTLIERFENVLHLKKPFRPLDFHGFPFCAAIR